MTLQRNVSDNVDNVSVSINKCVKFVVMDVILSMIG